MINQWEGALLTNQAGEEEGKEWCMLGVTHANDQTNKATAQDLTMIVFSFTVKMSASMG